MRLRILLAVVLCLSGVVDTARAEGDEAATSSDIAARVDTHLQRGIEFYAEKQFELAIVEFRAGYAIDPRPDFLFALAQAERLSGDCPTAIIYYRRFLETGPTANQAEAARVNMRRCERALESGPEGVSRRDTEAALDGAEEAAEPAPPAVPEIAKPPQIERRIDRTSRPWYRDSLGMSLAAGSVVGLGVGVGFWMAKRSAESAASDAPDYEAYESDLDRARQNRTLAIVGLSAGVALAGAATFRYVFRSRERHGTTLIVGATGDGAAALLAGRF